MPRRAVPLHLAIASPAQTTLSLHSHTSWLTLPHKRSGNEPSSSKRKVKFFLVEETDAWDDTERVWVGCDGALSTPPVTTPLAADNIAPSSPLAEDEAVTSCIEPMHHLSLPPRSLSRPSHPRPDPAEHRKRVLRAALRNSANARAPTDSCLVRPALCLLAAPVVGRPKAGSLLGAMVARREEGRARVEEGWARVEEGWARVEEGWYGRWVAREARLGRGRPTSR